MPDFKWDETEHPRGVLGRFIKGLQGAKTGESHNLQDNSAIVDVKNTNGRKSYRVRNNDRGYDESKTFRTAEDAAREALDRSARKTGPDTLGPGSASYKDVSAAADEALRRSQKNLPTAEEIKQNKRRGPLNRQNTEGSPKHFKTESGHQATRRGDGLYNIAGTGRPGRGEYRAEGLTEAEARAWKENSTKEKEASEREPGLADRQWASVSKAAQATLAHLGEQDAAGRPLTQRKQKDGEPQFAALRRAGLIEGTGNQKKLTPLGRLAHRNAEAAKAKREAIDADRKKVADPPKLAKKSKTPGVTPSSLSKILDGAGIKKSSSIHSSRLGFSTGSNEGHEMTAEDNGDVRVRFQPYSGSAHHDPERYNNKLEQGYAKMKEALEAKGLVVDDVAAVPGPNVASQRRHLLVSKAKNLNDPEARLTAIDAKLTEHDEELPKAKERLERTRKATYRHYGDYRDRNARSDYNRASTEHDKIVNSQRKLRAERDEIKKVHGSKPDFTKKESKEDRDRKRLQDDAPPPVGLAGLTDAQLEARLNDPALTNAQLGRARQEKERRASAEILRRTKAKQDAGSGKLPSGVPLGEGPTTHTGWLGRYRKLDHDALITELSTLRDTDPDAKHPKRRNALLSALAEAKGEKQIKKRPGAEKKKTALNEDDRKGLSVGARVQMEDRGRTVIGTVKTNDGGRVQVQWDGASSNWYSKDKQSLLRPVQSASEAKRKVGDRVYHVDFLGGSRDADHERLPYEILDMRTTPSGKVEYKVFDPETKGEFWGAQDLDLRTPDEFKHSHLAASAPERPTAAKLVAKLATAARIQAAHDIELRQAEASIAAYFPSRSAQMQKIQAEIRRRQVGAQAA